MNNGYRPREIEKKWQELWADGKLSAASDKKKNKYYCLIEFPYPSGDGLHVGHLRSYTALDIVARKKRMEGRDVLFPIGFDSFGLPTENYAIKVKRKPQAITRENIVNFTRQLKAMGFSFDWSRAVDTSDPKYYKWTQWIFLQLYKAGLVYQKEMPINWCPACKIGLANEEVVGGKCERCGSAVTKKNQKQWLFKITKYADRLISDLDKVDYLEKIKRQQINWIGRSEGANVKFQITSTKSQINSKSQIQNSKQIIEVFTTRPDTLYGVTYVVLSPEHELIKNLKKRIDNYPEVKTYIESAAKKSDLERTESKEKTGVELKGIKAINPVNQEEIPIFVADYVLTGYGTGAIMAVPGHDERDFEFAKKYNLEIRIVILPSVGKNEKELFAQREEIKNKNECFCGIGNLINSGGYNGFNSVRASEKITDWLQNNSFGRKAVNYKLRDWIFSRQHYWGEPIPLIHCERCGEVPVPEKDLPVELPDVKEYEPTNTGESPLAKITDWVNTKCPQCGGKALRETDTMPNWAGSNWYFIRYCDPHNDKAFADMKKMKHWLPVDLYNGGMEHTTLHLLYSRFWYKALYDLKLVPTDEPYQKRVSHGMVLAEDGQKMSKSRGNVINPDTVVKEFGADAVRLYEMFMGPFDQAINWSADGLRGTKRFLDKIFKIFSENKKGETSAALHKTIKKVTEDIDNLRFNTAVSSLMILVNEISEKGADKNTWEKFLVILSPFAPHLAEELWEKLGHKQSVFKEKWPSFDPKLVKDEEVEFIIQVNGKLRDRLKLPIDISENEAKEKALNSEKVKKYVSGEPKKVIFVKGRLINFVV
ncbi:MAG: leucine--tRNA ligase [Patescibacteria group bacterium]